MPLGAHLEELRSRLIKCLLALAGTFILCWVFRERLMAILVRPHVSAMRAFELDTTLKFGSYLEPVVAQLKACVVASLVVTAPMLIYQVWAFIAPGLFPRERYKAVKLGVACMVCFAAGVCFGYFIFVPVALRYLLRLSGAATEPVLMVAAYLSMFFLLTFALGIAFQTPVVVCYLVRWGVVDIESLHKNRKAVILAAFILGAILTPPDPMTQILMAVTLIVLYDLGGLLAAPSRATLVGFFKFTGLVAVVGGAFVGWYSFWPVAQFHVLEGTAEVRGRQFSAGEVTGMRRGAMCRTGKDGSARIAFGGQDGPDIYLAGSTRMQVNGPANVRLFVGQSLVVIRNSVGEFSFHAAPARAVLTTARAEFTCPSEDTLAITVFEGEVLAKVGAQTRRIVAGQTATFRDGGEPTDVSDAEQRWRALMELEESDPAPQAP